MGLSIKRRDSCDYLKDTYGTLISKIMASETIPNILSYLNNQLICLIEGKVPMDKLTITRALRSDYKNPKQIAHKVLADRIAKRDPGNKPKSGDRLKFVFINSSNSRALLGERIETPEFIRANVGKIKIDYAYYITNQLMKPLQQLLGLALEDICLSRGKRNAAALLKYQFRELEKSSDGNLEVYMKRKEQFCSKQIKLILFDSILTRIQNEKNGNRVITDFYHHNVK